MKTSITQRMITTMNDAYAHCARIGLIKDMYVKGWQQCVKFSCWVTADKLRLAG